MNVTVDYEGEELGRDIARPDTGVGQIEALGRGEAIDIAEGLLLHAVLKGTVGHLNTTIVTDVLAQGLLTVHKESGHSLLLAEPFGEHLRALIVLGLVFCRPPVHQVTVLIVLTALVVEAVTHLMTDDRSNGTVVADIIGLRIEERGLQDGGWEVDAVELWHITGVHRLWRHWHQLLVHGLAPVLAVKSSTCFLFDADKVLYEVLILTDVGELLQILPLIGVAYVDIHGVQLLQCLDLGGVAHPGVLLQAVLESLLQVFYQAIDTLLAGLGEIFCHIELTDGLRQVVVDFSDASKASLR